MESSVCSTWNHTYANLRQSGSPPGWTAGHNSGKESYQIYPETGAPDHPGPLYRRPFRGLATTMGAPRRERSPPKEPKSLDRASERLPDDAAHFGGDRSSKLRVFFGIEMDTIDRARYDHTPGVQKIH